MDIKLHIGLVMLLLYEILVLSIHAVLFMRKKKFNLDVLPTPNSVVRDITRRLKTDPDLRWVSDNRIEFVHVIAGDYMVGGAVLWIRVTITRISRFVRVEFAPTISNRQLNWAEGLVKQFQKNHFTAILLKSPARQPHNHELGVYCEKSD